MNHARRTEILDAVVDYTLEHGFNDLSWRPLAAALGVSPTSLVHRFGSKDQMLHEVLGRLRERIFAATHQSADLKGDGLQAHVRAVWERTSDPVQGKEFRLFFAVYGHALQAPQQFSEFLDHAVTDWMNNLREMQRPHSDPATATRTATLVIATIRGLLLDLLATGDRQRVHDAAETFIATL